jgi:hypothetical protein
VSLDLDTLTGHVRLSPGRPLPCVSSSRPDLAPRLARGRPAEQLPALLGAVFTLCSHAHRFTAQRAVDAALGRDMATSPAGRLALQAATARDQLLRIAHDWPRQLDQAESDEAGALLLRSCPLWRTDLDSADRLAALPAWLEHRWLGMGLAAWLRNWADDGEDWARAWCASERHSPVATTLRRHREVARVTTPSRPLDLLAEPEATMPALAALMAGMAGTAGFCSRPTWRGQPAETGPWTRRNDPAGRPAHNAWMRMFSRWIDVLQLAAPDGGQWLAHGALPLGEHTGIAWTEMARGLLVHRVQLEESTGGWRVADCQVLAPTEWNFHPAGVLAQSLSALRGTNAPAQARCLAVAFDPCVAFEIDACPSVEEAAHA